MITEVVDFRINHETAEQFIAGVVASKPIFEQVPGFIDLALHQEVEDPLNFTIMLTWKSLQHHLDMQKTSLFSQVHEKVSEFFASKPKVRHTEIRVEY